MTSIKKRAYSAPELISVKIDREITLVMETLPGGGENPPGLAPAAEVTTTEKSPFGSDKPDYSSMSK